MRLTPNNKRAEEKRCSTNDNQPSGSDEINDFDGPTSIKKVKLRKIPPISIFRDGLSNILKNTNCCREQADGKDEAEIFTDEELMDINKCTNRFSPETFSMDITEKGIKTLNSNFVEHEGGRMRNKERGTDRELDDSSSGKHGIHRASVTLEKWNVYQQAEPQKSNLTVRTDGKTLKNSNAYRLYESGLEHYEHLQTLKSSTFCQRGASSEQSEGTETFSDSDDCEYLGELSGENVQARLKHEERILAELTKSTDPKKDLIEFLEERVRLLNRIIGLYYDHHYTMKLKPTDVDQHWSSERMSKAEHLRRVTRWDMAIADAVKEQTNVELRLLKSGSFVFCGKNEAMACERRIEIIKSIVDEKYDTDDWFSFTYFSLLDIAEKKGVEHDGEIFQLAIETFLDQYVNKIQKLNTLLHSSIWNRIKSAVEEHGIEWADVLKELKEMPNEDYVLPKGKLYCRLLLNLAQVFQFNMVLKRWETHFKEHFLDRGLFLGIPFDKRGYWLNHIASATAGRISNRTTDKA